MSLAAQERLRKGIGICLLISCLLGLRLMLFLTFQLPAQTLSGVVLTLLTLGGYGSAVAAAFGLLSGRTMGYWCLYASTAVFLMVGTSIPYLPLTLTLIPERLRERLQTGVLALVNLSVTLLVFWLHHQTRRRAAAESKTKPR